MTWLALAIACTGVPAAPADTDVGTDTDTDAPRFPAAPWDAAFPVTGACGALASPLAAGTDQVRTVARLALQDVLPQQPWSIADEHLTCPGFYGGSHYGGYDAGGACETPSGWVWEGSWYGVYEPATEGFHSSDEFTGSRVRFADAAGRYDVLIDGTLAGYDDGAAIPTQREGRVTFGYAASGPYVDTAALRGWYRVDGTVEFSHGTPAAIDAYVYVADDGAGGPTGDACVSGTLAHVPECEEPDGTLTIEAATPAELVFDGATACDGCASVRLGGASAGSICL